MNKSNKILIIVCIILTIALISMTGLYIYTRYAYLHSIARLGAYTYHVRKALEDVGLHMQLKDSSVSLDDENTLNNPNGIFTIVEKISHSD